ncbi:MAG TPA: hypothetical protein VK205_15805 [Prolixibacteraceae bacterium]|nr:hypothetical protein [Prolixibacteraceae bacterium]
MKSRLITIHQLIMVILLLIVVLTVTVLLYRGYGYYSTPIEGRYFHPDNDSLKSSGIIGHGLGIIGSLMILGAVFGYMARKRVRWMSNFGILKYWLEGHIFFCTLGPVLILFHTTFKFGGIVAISVWCMVAVVLSGIIGRFIYIQIPHTIEGRELSLQELQEQERELDHQLRSTLAMNESIFDLLHSYSDEKPTGISKFIGWSQSEKTALRNLKEGLQKQQVTPVKTREVLRIYKQQISMKKRIERLATMQNLFKYWHVAHLPFALVMLVIMIIHSTVVIVFGYKWIF